MDSAGAIRLVLTSCVLWLGAAAWPLAQTDPAASGPPMIDWPVVTQDARPWTRWWWHGSSVTPAGLTAAMETYRDAGLGGLELTPIYGVRGAEDRFVPFLSREWMDLLGHTMRESVRLGLGLDMATGTGWPFGGPWVTRDEACRTVVVRRFQLAGGERLREPIAATQEPVVRAVGQLTYDLRGSILGPREEEGKPAQERPTPAAARGRPVTIADLVDPASANANLQGLALDQVRFPRKLPLGAVVAHAADGQAIDLTQRVRADDTLDWIAPAGSWTLYALFNGWHGKQVERAAPGGEGDVIDHFSTSAIHTYLSAFDRAFEGRDVTTIRAFFNDSYEVDDARGQADWTPRLLDEFEARRGYDLRRHLPALLGEDVADRNARVLTDYRETVSDLVLETFTAEWRAWAAAKRALVRNQSHGSPGNLLDLYAASDIPETEGTDLLRIKFASSAAHVTGKPLASAEAATWLNDHFLSSLGDVRQALDRYFLGGVNHVVYHGTAYSPEEAPWPGWLFYAAVHFQPANPMWRDFRALNEYVTRVQGFLQQGAPDADVLLYFPVHDYFAARGTGLLAHFDGGGAMLEGTPFRQLAERLQERGYAFDYVSDRQVAGLRATPDGIQGAVSRYGAVVVPAVKTVSLETAERLVTLARAGATVILAGGWPADVPGLARLEERRASLMRLGDGLPWRDLGGGATEARVGQGRLLAGSDVEALLARAGVSREPMVEQGLQFSRRRDTGSVTYFVANRGTGRVDGWVPIAVREKASLRDTGPQRASSGADGASAVPGSAVLFDPMQARRGRVPIRRTATSASEVYLQLAAGESCVLRIPLGSGETGWALAALEAYPFYRVAGHPQALDGRWRVEFVSGGPALPPAAEGVGLRSWTEFAGDAGRAFSGTARYSIRLQRPPQNAVAWRLDLGRVHETARVRLNGRPLGTLIGPDWALTIPAALLGADNLLEVEVSNLMANRIADMDRRGLVWKIFYNVNMPASRQENRGADGLFDASRWEPRPSGLLGPVTLTPLATVL